MFVCDTVVSGFITALNVNLNNAENSIGMSNKIATNS